MIKLSEDDITLNWASQKNCPLVSICTLTYNHGAYIGKAIDSFLMQKTTFPFEILINDDLSSDNTVKVIQEYVGKYPNIIKAQVGKKNIGMMNNFLSILNRSKGKYIALCDGDDYWTDPFKLYKQVKFLEENSDVSIVHSDFDWLDMSSNQLISHFYQNKNLKFNTKYSNQAYMKSTYIRTLTTCFVKSEIEGFEKILKKEWTVADVPLFLYLVRNKKIGYINESMGVYRRSLESVSASQNINKQYEFWKGVAPVRSYFYDYLKLDNVKLKKYLENEYYDGLFFWSIQSNVYPFEFKSLKYKVLNFRLTLNDFKLIAVKILKVLKLHEVYLKLKQIIVK